MTDTKVDADLVRKALNLVHNYQIDESGLWTEHEVAEAIAALSRLTARIEALEQWQPIETAKPEEVVLLWHPGSKYQDQGSVIGYMMRMGPAMIPIFGCTVFHEGDATHWRPLPAPPETDDGR